MAGNTQSSNQGGFNIQNVYHHHHHGGDEDRINFLSSHTAVSVDLETLAAAIPGYKSIHRGTWAYQQQPIAIKMIFSPLSSQFEASLARVAELPGFVCVTFQPGIDVPSLVEVNRILAGRVGVQRPLDQTPAEKNQRPRNQPPAEQHQRPRNQPPAEQHQRPRNQPPAEQHQRPRNQPAIEQHQQPRDQPPAEQNQRPRNQPPAEQQQPRDQLPADQPQEEPRPHHDPAPAGRATPAAQPPLVQAMWLNMLAGEWDDLGLGDNAVIPPASQVCFTPLVEVKRLADSIRVNVVGAVHSISTLVQKNSKFWLLRLSDAQQNRIKLRIFPDQDSFQVGDPLDGIQTGDVIAVLNGSVWKHGVSAYEESSTVFVSDVSDMLDQLDVIQRQM